MAKPRPYRSQAQEPMPTEEQWEEFVREWRGWIGGFPVRTGVLWKRIGCHVDGFSFLSHDTEIGRMTRFAQVLRGMRNCEVAGYILRSRILNGHPVWWLEPVSDDEDWGDGDLSESTAAMEWWLTRYTPAHLELLMREYRAALARGEVEPVSECDDPSVERGHLWRLS